MLASFQDSWKNYLGLTASHAYLIFVILFRSVRPYWNTFVSSLFGNSWELINGNLWQLLATFGNSWERMATLKNLCQFLATIRTIGKYQQLLTTIDKFRQLFETLENLWQLDHFLQSQSSFLRTIQNKLQIFCILSTSSGFYNVWSKAISASEKNRPFSKTEVSPMDLQNEFWMQST